MGSLCMHVCGLVDLSFHLHVSNTFCRVVDCIVIFTYGGAGACLCSVCFWNEHTQCFEILTPKWEYMYINIYIYICMYVCFLPSNPIHNCERALWTCRRLHLIIYIYIYVCICLCYIYQNAVVHICVYVFFGGIFWKNRIARWTLDLIR